MIKKALFALCILGGLGGIASATPTQVSTGFVNTCEIDAGALSCLGDNTHGQLGNGTTSGTLTTTFTAVPGMGSGVTQVSVALDGYNVCAIKSGVLYCWGDNTYGQIGDATLTQRDSPTAVDTTHGMNGTVVQVATSKDHTCATQSTLGSNIVAGVTYQGYGFCWGDNSLGQLGDNNLPALGTIIVPTAGAPLYVKLGPPQFAVAGGITCFNVLSPNATGFKDILCAGANNNGQLGIGVTNSFQAQPHELYLPLGGGNGTTVVNTLVTVSENHACALSGPAGTKPYCWGLNTSGQVGNGSLTSPYNAPTVVSGSLALTAISAGKDFTCGTNASSGACWGNGSNYQLDTPTTITAQTTPLTLPLIHLPATSITTGDVSTCFIHASSVVCVGNNGSGTTVTGPPTCGNGNLDTGETCDDENTTGGDGCSATCQVESGYFCSGTPSSCTASVAPTTTPLTVAAGNYNSCKIATGGKLYCWGDNSNGQLDNTFTTKTTPLAISGMSSGVTDVSVSGDTSGYTICAIKSGSLYCWGDNATGQLGVGDTTDRTSPTLVSSLVNVKRVATAGNHTCALVLSTTIINELDEYCWGDNTYGQLGLGNTTSHTSPTLVRSGGPRDIAANRNATCEAAVVSGTTSIYCWGRNDWGQLGTGSLSNTSSRGAAAMVGTQVSMGWNHTCGRSGTTVKCWGANDNGQIGVNNCGSYSPCSGGTAYYTTAQSLYGTYAFTSVSAGGSATCGIDSSNGAKCWGYGGHGQMGVGGTPSSCETHTGFHGITLNEWCNQNYPGVVSGPIEVAVAVGGLHVASTVSPLAVYSWGDSSLGQLGDSSTTYYFYPAAATAPIGGW